MKIGINASFLRKPGTGIGQVTHNALRALISHTEYLLPTQYEFFLYCEEEPTLDFELPKNFHIRTFLPFWKRDDVPRKILWEKQLPREAAKDNCEAFISLYQSASCFDDYKSRATGLKLLHHTMIVHDIIPRFFPQYLEKISQKIHWKMIEKGIRKADRIVAISEHTRADIIRELHIPESSITLATPDVAPIFRETVSTEDMASVLKKYDLTPGYIYHGGGLEIRKNTETLLRAYAQLMTRIPNSFGEITPSLVISGKAFDTTNKLATNVKSLVQKLHLEEKVKFLGFVPVADLPALYRGSLFFVYPSLYEGFGLPVLEALCQGVPVLSSNSSSLPEVGGEATLYFDPTDVEALTAQMERLLTDETLRSKLISQSAVQVAKFSWDTFVDIVMTTVKQ